MQHVIDCVIIQLNAFLLLLLDLIRSDSSLRPFVLLVLLFKSKTTFFLVVVGILPKLAYQFVVLSVLLFSQPELLIYSFKDQSRHTLYQVRVILLHSYNKPIAHCFKTPAIPNNSQLFKYVDNFFKVTLLNLIQPTLPFN